MKVGMHSQRIRAMEYCKKHSPEYYNRFLRKEHEDFLENRMPGIQKEPKKSKNRIKETEEEREKRIKEERRKRYWGMKSRFKGKSRARSKST